MYNKIKYYFLLIFLLSAASLNAYNIDLLSEYVFYPKRMIDSVNFNDIYKNPKATMLVALFQNNLNPKMNNGFLGIDFNQPIKIRVLNIDNNDLPEIAIEFSIDSIDRFTAIVMVASKNNLAVISHGNSKEQLLLTNLKNPNAKKFPLLVKNKKVYMFIDVNDELLNPQNVVDSAADQQRIKRSFEILEKLSLNPDDYSTLNFLKKQNKNINLQNTDVLLSIYTNIKDEYIDKILNKFKLEFLKEFKEETLAPQILVMSKKPKLWNIENYIFKKSELSKIDDNSIIYAAAPQSSVFYFAGKDDVSELKKIINKSDKLNIPLELRNYILKFVNNISGSYSFYINNDVSEKVSGENLKTEILKKYGAAILFEITNQSEFDDFVNRIISDYSENIKLEKNDGYNAIKLNVNNEEFDFYYTYIGAKKNIVVISSKLSELKKIEASADKNSLIGELKKQKYFLDTHNTFYYMNVKQILRDFRDLVIIQKLNPKLSEYITNSFDIIWGLTKSENDLTIQNFNIKQETEISIGEIYNLLEQQNKPAAPASNQLRK